MTDPSFHFADKLSPGDCLDHYRQQRPVLLRGAIDPAACRLSPDELAGLACEETVESRLIQQRADSDWQLRHGPLDETDFAGLPGSHWTLLVQDVDKYVPEVAAMLDAHSIVNKPFLSFIFNDLYSCQMIIPCSENPSKCSKKFPIER